MLPNAFGHVLDIPLDTAALTLKCIKFFPTKIAVTKALPNMNSLKQKLKLETTAKSTKSRMKCREGLVGHPLLDNVRHSSLLSSEKSRTFGRSFILIEKQIRRSNFSNKRYGEKYSHQFQL